MTFENLTISIFIFFSLFFSFCVIISKNPVHSILSLILVFFNTGSLLIFLGVEFLAMLFVIIYVGAVAVLFLFVIMLLNIKTNSLNLSVYRYLPILFLFASILFLEILFGFNMEDLVDSNLPTFIFGNPNFFYLWVDYISFSGNMSILGHILYTYFCYYFLLSSIILLLSMIGAIALTLHRRNDVKKQLIYKQVQRSFDVTLSWKI